MSEKIDLAENRNPSKSVNPTDKVPVVVALMRVFGRFRFGCRWKILNAFDPAVIHPAVIYPAVLYLAVIYPAVI